MKPGEGALRPKRPELYGAPATAVGRWWWVGLGFLLALVALLALIVLVPIPHPDGPVLPGPSTVEALHWQPKRALSPMDIHFGWGLRDRVQVLCEPAIEWIGNWYCRLQAKLQGRDITTEMGAREVVYEVAELDGREINILDIKPFVKTTAGGATREAANHLYWVTKAVVDLKEAKTGIRSDSFPPLVLGFIIDGKNGARYVVGADILDKFLARGDFSLIQGVDVFDTHSLRYKIQNSQHR